MALLYWSCGGSDGAMMTNVDSFSGTGVSGHDISVGLGKSKYWNEGVVTTLRDWEIWKGRPNEGAGSQREELIQDKRLNFFGAVRYLFPLGD